MRGINERHRTRGAPHFHGLYVDQARLAPLLESRGAQVLQFLRQLDTRQYLLQNSVTDAEFCTILALLRGRVTV
jgi:hypothetical protein